MDGGEGGKERERRREREWLYREVYEVIHLIYLDMFHCKYVKGHHVCGTYIPFIFLQ